MTGALVLLAALVAVGLLLRLLHRPDAPVAEGDERSDSGQPAAPATSSHGEFCCGMHVVCEKDLPHALEPVYYDDEELDAYAGREATAYTNAEIEQFRDILLTLLPADIAGWNRSLELRSIALPEAVRDEMLLIVAEARTNQA